MPATRSFLNVVEDAPDLVVALTEASIDSALLASLPRIPTTPKVMCFTEHDDAPGDPSSFVEHLYLVAQCEGNDPFDLPDRTPYNDPRIELFNLANFSVAFRIGLGLPRGVHPRVLPEPVLQLNKGPDPFDATFTIYCSQFTVIWNDPPRPTNGNQGYWHVWDQPYGEAWPMAVRVRFLHETVVGMQGMNVQQVRVDLDTADWVNQVRFGPVDSVIAGRVLKKNFLKAYADLMRGFGKPVLKLKTFVPPGRGTVGPDGNDGFMRITDFTTRIAPYPARSDPALGHDDCRALELLCAVNGRPLPPPPDQPFFWT